MYRTLDPEKIVATIRLLHRRIAERFPGASLVQVCGELADIAAENRTRATRIARPHIGLRLASGSIILAGVGLLFYVASIIRLKRTTDDLFGVMQGIEASVNLLIVMGAAVIFLLTLEARWKRRQSLGDLHELRSIVHVIDMHQLTKDPSTTLPGASRTATSPRRILTPYELTRYLDYCSEMLSLTAKVAALYAQSSRDDVVVSAANDIGQLTTNLSEKIWQKIAMVSQEMALRPSDGTAVPQVGSGPPATAAVPATPPPPPSFQVTGGALEQVHFERN